MLIGQTAATGLFTGRYAVQGNPQGSTYLPAVADVAKNAGYRTVALLANDAPGTVEICAGVRARAQALGLQIVLDRTYPRTTTAFGDYAAAAQAAGADVLVGCAFMPDSIALVRALAAAGVKPKLEAFSIGPTDPAFGRQLGPLADGIVGSTTWWPSLKTKGNARRRLARPGQDPHRARDDAPRHRRRPLPARLRRPPARLWQLPDAVAGRRAEARVADRGRRVWAATALERRRDRRWPVPTKPRIARA